MRSVTQSHLLTNLILTGTNLLLKLTKFTKKTPESAQKQSHYDYFIITLYLFHTINGYLIVIRPS